MARAARKRSTDPVVTGELRGAPEYLAMGGALRRVGEALGVQVDVPDGDSPGFSAAVTSYAERCEMQLAHILRAVRRLYRVMGKPVRGDEGQDLGWHEAHLAQLVIELEDMARDPVKYLVAHYTLDEVADVCGRETAVDGTLPRALLDLVVQLHDVETELEHLSAEAL
jgi:hypothetical protein